MAGRPSRLNALSVDVEEYFHVEAFAGSVTYAEWHSLESRVQRNVFQILEILSKHEVKATFFILGWVAQQFPFMVRRIVENGHEIGCHGNVHLHILKQTPDQFREDVRAARRCLMEQTQQAVVCYRAPSFSITTATLWALDILAEEGFQVDSSIFPVRHDLYGIPGAERFPHRRNGILEFPPSTISVANNTFGVGGGGYLRLMPYRFTRWAIRRINEFEKKPAMVYFHPWELDPEQPRITAPLKSRLRHYTNLAGMQMKIERLLQDFRFSTVSTVLSEQI